MAKVLRLVFGTTTQVVKTVFAHHWIGGMGLCFVTLYFDHVLMCVYVEAHVLMAVNRLWAVVFPYTYRECTEEMDVV